MDERSHVALTKCFYCGEGDRILLATKYYRTKSGMQPVKDLAPADGKVLDMEPCQKCTDWMKQGIILIGIDSAKSEPGWNEPPNLNEERKNWMPNPWRTGAWSVIKEEAFDRLPLQGPEAEQIREFAKKKRFMFLEHQVMVMLGIVKEGPDEGEMQQDGGVQEEVPEA
jgi:hypothetical protein